MNNLNCNATSQNTKIDKDFTLSSVPWNARKGFSSMFFVMLGFTFFSASMSVGAKLGNGLSFDYFVYACIIGGTLLSIYCGLLAYIACDTGLGIDLLCKRAFGTKGSYLSSAVLGITQTGWFGVGVAMFALPTAELLGINEWYLVLLAGLIMTWTATIGIKALEIVSIISVPLIALLGMYSISLVGSEHSIIEILNNSGNEITLVTGIGFVIGSFVSGGTATPNFIRFSDSRKNAVITTIVAFFIGNTLMFCFGAVGGAFTQKDDIFYVMIMQELAIPAIIVLGANIWTTNNNALYTGGMAFTNITKIRKKITTIISGLLGTVLAIWLYHNFCGWLSVLNCMLPPVGIVVILDYFCNKNLYPAANSNNQSSPNIENNISIPKIRYFSLCAVIVGFTVALLVPFGIAALNSLISATIIFLLGLFIQKRYAKIL